QSMSPEEMGAARRLFEENNVVESPVLLAHRNPEYPDLARVARVDGQVILQAIVGVDGRVEDVEVIRVNRPNLGFE
ncbi:MAG: hypothetical protein GTN89_02060, partial [Acidobacteria bacterium]|nr:hypothetical protein [Acidobacteriota bacterium]NIM61604.1 hypothetical protein [Acidobacteriota bacterium]NIO58159.1 hypothetical protein [Acidobacteriota bacterium]NIQ29172.1 hypothetical protein [Acidobacteriota bacterium]NIQ83712.1 hypothetical protein [Acidobacteriota bacterium]